MDKSVQKTLIIMAGILVVALIVLVGFTSLVAPANTITGNGQATIDAMPDLVSVYFTVQTRGETSEEANSENAEITDDLITNILKKGFERKDIQTQSFNVYPDYKYVNNQRKENGYVATHSLKVEMPTEQSEKIGSVIDAGIEAGAGISNINFELSQEKQNKYKAEAIRLAAEDSRIKAEALAQGLGKELGKLVSVSDSDFGYNPWIMYSGSGMAEDAAIAKQASTSIQPSDQKISASVTAVFKIK